MPTVSERPRTGQPTMADAQREAARMSRRVAVQRCLARAGEHHRYGLEALDQLALRSVRGASIALKSWECTAEQLQLHGNARRTCERLHSAGWVLDALGDVMKAAGTEAEYLAATATVDALSNMTTRYLADAAIALSDWADDLEREEGDYA